MKYIIQPGIEIGTPDIKNIRINVWFVCQKPAFKQNGLQKCYIIRKNDTKSVIKVAELLIMWITFYFFLHLGALLPWLT